MSGHFAGLLRLFCDLPIYVLDGVSVGIMGRAVCAVVLVKEGSIAGCAELTCGVITNCRAVKLAVIKGGLSIDNCIPWSRENIISVPKARIFTVLYA